MDIDDENDTLPVSDEISTFGSVGETKQLTAQRKRASIEINL